MMEESHDDDHDQYLMWMKRKQVLKSHIQPIIFGDHHHHHGNYNNKNNYNYNYNYYYYSSSTSSSWEERAFAEDAARILGAAAGGSTLTWPPRSYSCTFCNREFRSAQALGGHMNVHRRDRARLKQNLIISPHHQESLEFDHHHHKNDYNSLSLGENYGQQEQDAMISTPYSSSSSSIIWGHKKIGSPSNNSEHGATEEETKRGKENIIKNKGLLHCSVETDLTVGLISSSMFGQNSSPSCIIGDGNDDEEAIISCKRLKTNTLISSSSSLPLMKQCSKDKRGLLAFQSAEKVIGTMEDLDLELRLGKQQKVN